MLKKWILMTLALLMFLAITGCGKTKTLQCDGCGKDVQVAENSNMEEDWIVFCKDCKDIDLDK